MINSISGVLTFRYTDCIGVENHGVEWAVETSTTTAASLQMGKDVRIYTHLHHTQDTMKLYGFASVEERRLFLALLTVSGVGPSLARKILSGMSPERLTAALDSEDLAALSTISGLGKKTAQKIVLQLRGKLTADDAEGLSGGEAGEMVEALSSMGFDTKQASRVVQNLLNDPSLAALAVEEREKEVLRQAIVALSS